MFVGRRGPLCCLPCNIVLTQCAETDSRWLRWGHDSVPTGLVNDKVSGTGISTHPNTVMDGVFRQ